MASTTTVIDMPMERANPQHPITSSNDPIPLRDITNPSQVHLGSYGQGTGTVVDAFERWDSPRINTYRLAAIFFAFLNFGMNDGSYGALVPYVCPSAARCPFRRSYIRDLDRS